jgi:hypothetical protein
LAFSKPRTPMSPCFCLQIPASHQHRSSPPASNGMLPPASKPGRGKCTTAATLLDLIKDVEIAISCRKGRSGTAAGDVAFPKGKENLASVLKRYKRRLSNKLIGSKWTVSRARFWHQLLRARCFCSSVCLSWMVSSCIILKCSLLIQECWLLSRWVSLPLSLSLSPSLPLLY